MLRLRDFGVMEGVEDLVNLPAEKMMTRAESLLVERGLAELKKGNFELQTKANRRLTLAKLHAQVRKRVVASRRESRIKGYESKSNAAGNEVRVMKRLAFPSRVHFSKGQIHISTQRSLQSFWGYQTGNSRDPRRGTRSRR